MHYRVPILHVFGISRCRTGEEKDEKGKNVVRLGLMTPAGKNSQGNNLEKNDFIETAGWWARFARNLIADVKIKLFFQLAFQTLIAEISVKKR